MIKVKGVPTQFKFGKTVGKRIALYMFSFYPMINLAVMLEYS